MQSTPLRVLGVLVALGATGPGCLSYRWKAQRDAVEDPQAAVAGLRIHSTKAPYEFVAENTTDGVLFVSQQRSVLEQGDHSVAVTAGETRVMHTDLVQADLAIAPRSKAAFSLYPTSGNASWSGPWKFRVATHDDRGGALTYVVVEVPQMAFTTNVSDSDRTWCYVTGILWGGWCWFISPEAEDTALAKKLAAERLGAGADLEFLGRE